MRVYFKARYQISQFLVRAKMFGSKPLIVESVFLIRNHSCKDFIPRVEYCPSTLLSARTADQLINGYGTDWDQFKSSNLRKFNRKFVVRIVNSEWAGVRNVAETSFINFSRSGHKPSYCWIACILNASIPKKKPKRVSTKKIDNPSIV